MAGSSCNVNIVRKHNTWLRLSNYNKKCCTVEPERIWVICIPDSYVSGIWMMWAKYLKWLEFAAAHQGLMIFPFFSFLFFKFLEDISPFLGATDTPVLLWVMSVLGFKARVDLFACFLDPQIHLWCDTCWLCRGQHGSRAFSIHIHADMSASIAMVEVWDSNDHSGSAIFPFQFTERWCVLNNDKKKSITLETLNKYQRDPVKLQMTSGRML